MRIAIFLVLIGLIAACYYFFVYLERPQVPPERPAPTDHRPRPVEPRKQVATPTPRPKPESFSTLRIPQGPFDVFVNGVVAESGELPLVPGKACIMSYADGACSHEWIKAEPDQTYSPGLLRRPEDPLDDWFQFQGSVARRGLVSARDRDELECVFTLDLDDVVESSLVGWREVVLLSSERASITAVNRRSGERLWSRGENGSNVTPVVLDEFVFCASDEGLVNVYRLKDGKKRGSVILGSYPTSLSPCSESELMVTTADQNVHFLKIRKRFNNRVALKIERTVAIEELGRANGNPAIAGSLALLRTHPTGLLAISIVDGSRQWMWGDAEERGRNKPPQWEFVAETDGGTQAPSIAEDVAVFVDGDQLLAVKWRSGERVWTTELVETGTSSLAVAYGMVYLGDAGGAIRAFSLHNGLPVFKRRISSKPILASPIVFKDKILAATGEGKLALLHAFTGNLISQNEVLAGCPIVSTPLVSDDAVVAVNQKGKMAAFK